jgi:phage terminase large subunit-like protein
MVKRLKLVPRLGDENDKSKGGSVIRWIQDNCYIPEGEDVGKPVKLRDWQKQLIAEIYNNKFGTRRAIISFGRKNAKTTLAAFLLLAHFCSKTLSKPNSQRYSAAQSRDQAGILFALAAKIVRLSPVLRDFVTVRDTAKQLYCPGRGTLYRALSAEVSTAFGLSPSFTIFDELGQWRTITIGLCCFPRIFPVFGLSACADFTFSFNLLARFSS